MRAEARYISTGKGVHATRSSLLGGNRPLKPSYSRKRILLLWLTLLASVSLLVQQNSVGIASYINRPVAKIRIENQWQQFSEAEVKTLLAPFIGTGFFNFDVNGIKHGLEQHPWVAQASVKRIWPDTVALTITEQVAIARWGDRQLLNQYGEIFEPGAIDNYIALPQLVGQEGTQQRVMEQYQLVNQILFPSGIRLNGLFLSPRGSWDLTLNDTMHVNAGRLQVIEKLQRFVSFYARQPIAQSARFRAIDLRYGNGIAVQSVDQELTGVAAR
jgi:cell division protein FtsQ